MGWWDETYEEREARRPRNRLKEKLKELLRISDEDALEVVVILEEMIEEKTDDLDDKINQRGMYDPDY